MILIHSLLILSSKAENLDYVPMIREGRVWEYHGESLKYAGEAFHYMKFDGIETIDGRVYHRFVKFKTLVVNYVSGAVVHRDYGNLYVYYLREEPGRVFVLTESGNVVCSDVSAWQDKDREPEFSEFMVYDFTKRKTLFGNILPRWN